MAKYSKEYFSMQKKEGRKGLHPSPLSLLKRRGAAVQYFFAKKCWQSDPQLKEKQYTVVL
jgi:hypothetical protein